MYERIGPWHIATDLTTVVVTDTRDGTRRHTSVILFPVGYRVGLKWEGGDVPRYVDQAARSLVRKIAIREHNAARH